MEHRSYPNVRYKCQVVLHEWLIHYSDISNQTTIICHKTFYPEYKFRTKLTLSEVYIRDGFPLLQYIASWAYQIKQSQQ